MNRVTIDGGQLVGGLIVRGSGSSIDYYRDGQRATMIRDVLLDGNGASYWGERRDYYQWRASGALSSVTSEDTGYAYNPDGSIRSSGVFDRKAGSSEFDYNEHGFHARQIDRDASDAVVYDRLAYPDALGKRSREAALRDAVAIG